MTLWDPVFLIARVEDDKLTDEETEAAAKSDRKRSFPELKTYSIISN